MPTYSIANSNRDGSSYVNQEYTLPSQHIYGTMYVGYESGNNFDAAWIWDTTTSTPLPQGSTILTASVLVTRQSTDFDADLQGTWYGFAVDTPTDFTNSHTAHRISDHHTRTTANVNDDSWANAATHTSPSLVTVVQEVVNRAGFSGVIGLTFRIRTTSQGWFNYTDYTDNASNAAQLTVTWSAPDPFPLPTYFKARTHPDLRSR